MLMAGSTGKLFTNFILTIWMIIFWVWFAATTKGVNFLGLAFVILCLTHSLILTTQLIGLQTPVLSAGPNGLVLSTHITSHDLIEWKDVKKFDVYDFHLPVYIPGLSYLIIRSKRKHFNGLSRLLPTTWFGFYLLPTRLLKGGSKSARQIVGIIKNIREDERHAKASNNQAFIPENSIAWALLRNSEFPIGKNGASDDAMISAVKDSLMEQAGVHRDLLPEDIRQHILSTGSGKELAELGEKWGRQLVAENHNKSSATSQPPQPKLDRFEHKGILLNGKPIS